MAGFGVDRWHTVIQLAVCWPELVCCLPAQLTQASVLQIRGTHKEWFNALAWCPNLS
jgi:hypothetical protein